MMNIDAGVNKYHDTANAVLVDVRNEDEFAEGHIPGSENVPLGKLGMDIYDVVPDLGTPVFLYCRSGNRSAQAAAVLSELGYEHITNIGGIMNYQGELEK